MDHSPSQLGPAADEQLARLLIAEGKLRSLDLARIARVQAGQERVEPLSRLVVRLGLVSERDTAAALAQLLQLPLARKADYRDVLLPPGGVSVRFLKEHLVVPLLDRAGTLTLAMADPRDDHTVAAMALACARRVARWVGAPADIEAAIERLGGSGKSRMERIVADAHAGEAQPGEAQADEQDVEQLRDLASEAPAIRLVSLILQRAVDRGASDVHIEPFASRLKLRYRIDGVLQEAEAPPAHLTAAVVSRVKIMAKLDIAERRVPQDGRISLRVQGRDLDVRVSTAPTMHGESVVLRLLNRGTVALEFAALGFEEAELRRFAELLERPHGMVLVTGPTGSGKTTTLYTALRRLNTSQRKIITVEDPVEYQIEGVNQIQVRPAINLDFATALRSIVRQDPDVIMVGEMRDRETARICVQSALTGHLVLSTLHTNDAPGCVTRLRDMGIEDYLITSTVNAVAGQRLVRLLCTHCRVPSRTPGDARLLYKPAGCERCSGTGYRGRSAVLELMPMCERIRRLVLERAETAQIRRAARAEGMRTMYEHGLAKAYGGLTSLEEVMRVTCED
jgi:general secretion pathway protein E